MGVLGLFFRLPALAQLSYDAAAAYGLRKVMPAYSGSAIRVVRTCDNGTGDIGFTSCGRLDTVALKTFVIAANPLSAITATAATAYSLRRLYCAYAGHAVRVRSSAAGSPTLDIGFTPNGDLDTAALKIFVGANSAFVTTWYDQSGNGRHALQAINGSQPRLVNAGVVDRQGKQPSVRFLGMGCSMSTAAFTTYTAAACFNSVARVSTNVTYNTIVNKTTNNYPAPLDLYNGQMVIGSGPSYNFFSYGQTFNASLPLSVWTYQAAASGSYNFYYNGGSTGSGSVGFYGDNGNPLVLGSRADGVTGLNGYISEIITFNALPSVTDRQFLEWAQAQYYSIAGFALGTLPVSPASASITAWYDQTGGGKTAVQATAANQPQIINAGVILKNGAVPAMSFAGFPQNLVAPLSTAAYPLSLSLLVNTSGSTAAGAFVKLGTSANAGQAGIAIGIGNSGGTFDNVGTSVIGLKEWVAWSPSNPNVSWPANSCLATMVQQSGGGGTSIYVNGTNIPLSSASNAVGASLAGNLFIGGYTNGTNRYAAVKQSEVVVLGSALSVTRRTLLESNQGTYYNIVPSNNKYTAPAANAYRLYMNGVGRESSTDSVAGTRSTTGMGITIGTGATDFLKDNGDYLTYAMDCPAVAISTLNLPATVTERWYNDWYLNKTDVGSNNGTITFFFDFSDYGFSITPGPGTAGNYDLLVRNTPSGTFSIVAGTTRSVVGDRIRFAVDASNIPTDCYYTVGTRNTSASPLPVELVSFGVSCVNGKVEVDWITAAQYHNNYFSVERSSNGIDFESLGTVKGAGTAARRMSYSFMDENPLQGLAYYRLTQVDFDGSQKSFPLSVVNCRHAEVPLSIYPNPTTGDFTLAGARPGSKVSIYNQLGLLVYEQVCHQSREKFVLHLPNGVYFVKVESDTTSTFKLLIQK